MQDSDKDALTSRDKAGRRQFIRRGAAFVAVGGLMSTSQSVYADDCDRAQVGEKNAQAPGTDSDTGSSADPTGCGRKPEKPKISQAPSTSNINQNMKVKKIKA